MAIQDDQQQQITELRRQIQQMEERRTDIGAALLVEGLSKEEFLRLSDENSDLAMEIERLEAQVRQIEFPGEDKGMIIALGTGPAGPNL